MSKICKLLGHRELNTDSIRARTEKVLIDLIENHDVSVFYTANNGDFDYMCNDIITELKKIYKHIKLCWIAAYSFYNMHAKEKMIYDEIIIPNFRTIGFKQTMAARNEWMVENSDVLVYYINHGYGVTKDAVEYALNTEICVVKI